MSSLSLSLLPVVLSLVSHGAAMGGFGSCSNGNLPKDTSSWPNSLPHQYPWEDYDDLHELCIGPSTFPSFKCCNSPEGLNCEVPEVWQSDMPRANQLIQSCQSCTCNKPTPPSEDPDLANWDITAFQSVVEGIMQQKVPDISCDATLSICRSNRDCQPEEPSTDCNSLACARFGRDPSRVLKWNGMPQHLDRNGKYLPYPKPRRPQAYGRCAPRDALAYFRKSGGGGGMGGFGGGMGGSLLGKRGFGPDEVVFTGECHCNATYIHEDCCNAPSDDVKLI